MRNVCPVKQSSGHDITKISHALCKKLSHRRVERRKCITVDKSFLQPPITRIFYGNIDPTKFLVSSGRETCIC